MHNRCLFAGISLAMVCACSGATESNGGSGGGTSTAPAGGSTGNGGNSATGGVTSGNTGGVVGTGGSTGGAVATGGVVNTGGAPAGGNPNTGGTPNTGGIANTGGQVNTGGAVNTGGSASPGGASATGGKSNTGGAVSTGGKSATGGLSSTGGKASSGGASSAAGSSSTTACSRDILQTAVDSYLSAMQSGNTSSLSLTSSAKYTENGATVALGQGLWATPLTPDYHRNLLDVDRCSTFSEIIIASGSHPYVLGTRLTVTGSQISAISVIVTDCDDWGFNASSYLTNSRNEEAGWGAVAPADQLTRQALLDAGTAYFAYWSDPTVSVPWGYPCSRLEGGMETNPSGNASVTCDVGITTQTFAIKVNDQLVDVDYGMVVDFLNLPGPDSHMFRVNTTGIRYIHTLTDCYVNGAWQCPGTAPTCN